jgi:hypothetical protein
LVVTVDHPWFGVIVARIRAHAGVTVNGAHMPIA